MNIEARITELQKRERVEWSPSVEHQRRMLCVWPMRPDDEKAQKWLKDNYLTSRMRDIDPSQHEGVVAHFERDFGTPTNDEVIS